VKNVAVIAHTGKTLDGGLGELRRELAIYGITDPDWYEVPKSRKAPPKVKRALKRGADLVIVWGGDGMVQRCVDVLAGTKATIAIIPAGTANLLATNLGIPKNLKAAVAIAVGTHRRKLDVGRINGEGFAVMAGAGFDARMIGAADGPLKDRFGRLAYVWTGAKSVRVKPFRAKIDVDGKKWFRGKASCILVGNVGHLFGGVEAFENAAPDDGTLEVGVVTADGAVAWMRTIARAAIDTAAASPYTETTSAARRVRIRFDRKVPYEVDGGDRTTVKELRIRLQPGAIRVCVPGEAVSVAA
jgi:YegS/Rv2252/BmrU family lipid kinase